MQNRVLLVQMSDEVSPEYVGSFLFIELSGDPHLDQVFDLAAGHLLAFEALAEQRGQHPIVRLVVLGIEYAEPERIVAAMRACDRMQDRHPMLRERLARYTSSRVQLVLMVDFVDAGGVPFHTHICLPTAEQGEGFEYEPPTEYEDGRSGLLYATMLQHASPSVRLNARAIQPEVIRVAKQRFQGE